MSNCVRWRSLGRFLPHLIDLALIRKINLGKVFDSELPIADVAEGYPAVDERPSIKTLLRIPRS